jgi:hypothetical protein
MGCGCGGPCDDTSVAEEVRRDVYDNPGEAMQRAREMGCDEVHSHEEDGKTVFMPCKSHDEYKMKSGGKDVAPREEKEVEGYGYSDGGGGDGSCPPGKTRRGGRCVPMAVTLECEITHVEAHVVASTGQQVVTITGVAFHEGFNKNGWKITPTGAEMVADRMIGEDITLGHPSVDKGRFRRNMNGGIEEAVVGEVTDAFMVHFEADSDRFEVHFEGDIYRSELFAALESGLWLRQGYGVSIGGTGIPDEIMEAEDGRQQFVFETDFDFDHLAIVHRPAYERATISSVGRENREGFNNQLIDGPNIPEGTNMADEIQEEEIVETPIAHDEKMEALIAEKVLLEARVAEFEAAEAAKIEDARLSLVKEASDLGMSGHDELSTETLSSLIASWRESHPDPEPVVMEPVATIASEDAAPAPMSKPVVANFLNGSLVETPSDTYAAAWNWWASKWNNSLSASESDVRAKKYEELN